MISIQKYQIKKYEDDSTLKLLKKGGVVTNFEVSKLMNAFYEKYTPGLPYFKPIEFVQYSVSNKDQYNSMFSILGKDLETIYDVYYIQYDDTVNIRQNLETSIKRIYNNMENVVMENKILNDHLKNNISYESYIISFNNLRLVNMKNLIRKNIPSTSSEINFELCELANPLKSTVNDRLDLSKAQIDIKSSTSFNQNRNDYNCLFNDMYNYNLNIETISSSKIATPSIDIDIKLDKITEISKVQVKGYCLYNTTLKLFLSKDGVNFLEKQEIDGGEYNTFRFVKEEAKCIKIKITKNTYDMENHNINEYYYFFILNNINIHNDKYSDLSTFTSNRLKFSNNVSDIIIDPDHLVYPETDISYYVGVEDNNENITWMPIEPNESKDLKVLNKEEKILNYFTSKYFGETDFDRDIKKFCFYIHGLPSKTNLNSIYLRAGHSQWLLERLDVSDKYGVDYPEDKKVNLSDYNKARVTEIAPLEATMLEMKCEKTNNYIVMSQYVICENEVLVENRHINFDTSDGESFNVAVIINGKQILSKDDKYTFKLDKGENTVKIMFLLCDLNISDMDRIKRIRHNFNLMPYAKNIFAGPEMECISYNSLVNNVDSKSIKYYSYKIIDGMIKIVTKFDPNYIIKPSDPGYHNVNIDLFPKTEAHINNEKKLELVNSYREYIIPDIKMNNSEYFRMYIKYKYISDENYDKYVDKNNKVNVRIMAKLNTNDLSISPIIKNIKVIGE